MRQEQKDKSHQVEIKRIQSKRNEHNQDDFVLEKGIFINIFEKDIRRVFIYKKSERLAKAIHLITPAFADSMSLKNRIDTIAVGLVDAAIQPRSAARTALSRELLALSSVLSIARSSGLLSSMNTELIVHEARTLLQEIAAYEEPHLLLDETPTLSDIARHAGRGEHFPSRHMNLSEGRQMPPPLPRKTTPRISKRHITDTKIKDRREAVMSVIRNKDKVSIKDISTVIRGISEKTIQRELQALVEAGTVHKQGERRWSTYTLA